MHDRNTVRNSTIQIFSAVDLHKPRNKRHGSRCLHCDDIFSHILHFIINRSSRFHIRHNRISIARIFHRRLIIIRIQFIRYRIITHFRIKNISCCRHAVKAAVMRILQIIDHNAEPSAPLCGNIAAECTGSHGNTVTISKRDLFV